MTTNLPKAVQRQLEQAEAVQAQIAQAETPDVVTDAAQLAPPPPPPAAAPTPVEPPPPVAPEDKTDWKNKALTLEGMLRSQVPELKTRNTVLEGQLAQLQAELVSLKSAKTAEPPAKPTVDPKDIEQFGSDMMDMVQRYVTNTVTAMEAKLSGVATLEQRVRALEGSVQRVGERTDESLEAQFWTLLRNLVPDLDEVNSSEGWLAWLSQTDKLTGMQRQAALDAARKALNAERVAAIFDLYKQSLPPKAKAALASQVSPGTGGAGAAPVASAKPQLISEKFIHEFYRDQQRGKYVGREAEAAQIEAAIHQAAAEGRVVR